MAYLVAASKVWDPQIAEKLSAKYKKQFILLTQQEQLTVDYIEKNKVDKIFFTHWSSIIKPEIYNKVECIIFHMTDLPYGRGGSPLQNLIVRGHTETKISAIRCAEGIDTGPIYLKKDLSLHGSAQEIFMRASQIVEQMICEIEEKKMTPEPQKGEAVQFKRRKPEEGNLAQLNSVKTIYDYIRMLDADGYPNAFLEIEGIRYEFSSAKLSDGEIEAKVRIKK